MKVFDHIWLWLILLLAGYILIAPSPEARIVRICEPVNWFGRVISSFTLLVAPNSAGNVQAQMLGMEHGCQSLVYRQMYPAHAALLKQAAESAATEK